MRSRTSLEESTPRDLALELSGFSEEPHLMRGCERRFELVPVRRGESDFLPEGAGASAEEPSPFCSRFGGSIERVTCDLRPMP
jgi:hypothetical protein